MTDTELEKALTDPVRIDLYEIVSEATIHSDPRRDRAWRAYRRGDQPHEIIKAAFPKAADAMLDEDFGPDEIVRRFRRMNSRDFEAAERLRLDPITYCIRKPQGVLK